MDNIDIVVDKKNKDFGGVSSLTIGTPGCGKTNTLCKMCIIDLDKSIVVWRAKNTCQWAIFLNTKCNIVFWLHKDVKYKLIDRDKEREVKFKDFGEVRYWDDPEYLVENLAHGKINVIYVKHNVTVESEQRKFIDEWNSIFSAMLLRNYIYPISIHFDEMEDLAPESKPGFYTRVTEVANNIKEFRKNWIHFNGATHKDTEIFWVVRNKIPWKIKMKGSKKDKNSKLYRGTLSKLNPGEAYIEDDHRFDFIKFSFLGKPRNFILKTKLKKN
jgi:hypothetical protein